MKIERVFAENFGSYKQLTFTPENKGLVLVSGPTGSGKSTLCDLIPWTLFGVTAKNGLADDVRGWRTNSTTCQLSFFIKGSRYTVLRSRGANKDFYFKPEDGQAIRGKDLADTQKLLNQLLGMDAETYLASAYYHEFSASAGFFTANASSRRQLTEQFADLEFAKKLIQKCTEIKKHLKTDLIEAKEAVTKAKANLDASIRTVKDMASMYDKWAKKNQKNYEERVAEVEAKRYEWELSNRLAILSLEESIDVKKLQLVDESKNAEKMALTQTMIDSMSKETCESCGSPKKTNQVLVLMKDYNTLERQSMQSEIARKQISEIERQIKILKEKNNPIEFPKEDEEQKKNPYSESIVKAEEDKIAASHSLDCAVRLVQITNEDLEKVELLLSAMDMFRGELIKNTVNRLEQKVNDILTSHFDGEILVAFTVAESDKLEVVIKKDGNECSFYQLSKGQRQLLKFCFGLSVMGVMAERSGSEAPAIFIDEALDGLDDNFKLKAFNVLSSLQTKYPSIFVVEHSSELKPMFNNKIEVTLKDGESEICESA